MKILLINPPVNYSELVQTDITNQFALPGESPDLVHLFCHSRKDFEARMKNIIPLIIKNKSIIIWISWYKKSSKLFIDLTEDDIRSFALKHELVDVKVCAVSEEWSGLKLVVPLSKRT